MSAPSTVLLVGALLAATVVPAARQGRVLDSGTLAISRGGTIVGREEFTVRHGRSSGPDGYTITATVTYPPTSPGVTLSFIVELGPDSLPAQVQCDIHGSAEARVYARFGPRRVTLRTVRPGGESARELPATGLETVVDDSVFGLYAIPPARGARHAVSPRTGSRQPMEILDRGPEQTTLQGVPRELRHEVLRLGTQERHLWYDQEGRLMRVEVPALGLVAERGS